MDGTSVTAFVIHPVRNGPFTCISSRNSVAAVHLDVVENKEDQRNTQREKERTVKVKQPKCEKCISAVFMFGGHIGTRTQDLSRVKRTL